MRQYRASFSREFAFQVEQHCQKCGKYVNTARLRGRGSAEGSSSDLAGEGAVTSAMKQIYRQQKRLTSRYGLATYGVVCPSCRRVIARARKRHFPKGFRSGLQQKAWKAFFRSLVWAAPFVILAVLWSRIMNSISSERRANLMQDEAGKYVAMFFDGLLYLLIVVAAYFVVRLLRDYWIVMRMAFTLGRFSERELHAVVREAHDANHESLHDRFWGRYRFIRRFWERLAQHSPKERGEAESEGKKRSRSHPGRT